MMKRLFVCAAALLVLGGQQATASRKPVYKNPKTPIEERVEDLLARMTVEEKVLQLNQYTAGRNTNENNVGEEVAKVPAGIGSLIYFCDDPHLRNEIQRKAVEESRLGIPVLFAHDVIHGFRTVYPISLGQACSWNPALVERACVLAARESRLSGVDWTFSPMIDVARDPRWGRVAEGYGEDPYLNGVFGAASVRGYQGDDLTSERCIAACLKHYVGYGASEAGRDYVYTEISRQTLWDTYLLPYRMCVEAGAATLMAAFNDISGVPASANRYTLTEVLKARWKHDGFVVSDWGSVGQLVPQGAAASLEEASALAFNAGVEMDMMSHGYDRYLAGLVGRGAVSREALDEAVRRVLRLKFRLGLFENPYTRETTEEERFLRPEDVRVAEQLAEESFVLLKNEGAALPLAAGKRIALIGPMARDRAELLGSWRGHGREQDVVSIYDGLVRELGSADRVICVPGCDFEGEDESGFAEAAAAAREADAVVLCLGEKRSWSGENASRSTIALPAIQERLAVVLKQTGKPLVLVLSSGRPLELCRLEPLADAIVEIWQPGIAGGRPLAGILTGRINPSGRLAMTFPYSSGQIPIYYNRRQSARPHQGRYQDATIEPLYAFGHGLSYTTFSYGEPAVSAARIGRGGRTTVTVEVTNTGAREGAETVMWFVSDRASRITRPLRELRHFEKRTIPAGGTARFAFEIEPLRDLGFVDDDGRRFVETGDYFVEVMGKRVKIEVEE